MKVDPQASRKVHSTVERTWDCVEEPHFGLALLTRLLDDVIDTTGTNVEVL